MVKRLEGKLASLANIHCARNLEQKTAALQSGAGRGTQSRDMPWLPCLAWVSGGGAQKRLHRPKVERAFRHISFTAGLECIRFQSSLFISAWPGMVKAVCFFCCCHMAGHINAHGHTRCFTD